MPRVYESTRRLYFCESILLDPVFIACLNDTPAKVSNWWIFIEWIRGEIPSHIAEEIGMCASGVREHIQRSKAIFDIFAGRSIKQRFQDERLPQKVELMRLFYTANGHANPRLVRTAVAKFLDCCDEWIDPTVQFFMMTEEELMQVPGTGEKSRELYLSTKKWMNEHYIPKGESN